jgi:phospholipid/cholesterol/gamma-HCH transport system substrate-binding protein
MSKKAGSKIKLGIFITLGLLFFIIGIYAIGRKKNMFEKTFRVSALFKNVSGLQSGSNVRYAGIIVGTIEDIEIVNDSLVRVDLLVKESIHRFIKTDSKASIGSDGLMGYKLVNITAGSPKSFPVKNDGFIYGTSPVEFDDILKNVKLTAENATAITTDLADILNKVNNGHGMFGQMLNDTVLFGAIEETVIATGKNLEKGTKGFSENMEALKHNVLLRGYYKKKEREKQKALEQKNKKANSDSIEKKKKKFLFFKKKDKTDANDED